MDGLLTGGKYTGWEDRFYTFSWIFAGVAMVLFFLFLLVAEGFIFLYPRKGREVLESWGYPLAQNNIGLLQLQHFIGIVWGIGQAFYTLYLPGYDPLPAGLNPDIVGRGVRFSVFAPSAGLIISSVLGYFHVFDSGAKELGMVQLFTLACYMVNLTIWGPELKDPELLLVLLLADSLSSALSIALNDKQVLSARTLVCAIGAAQLSMLGIMGWSLGSRSISIDGPWRYLIFWWGVRMESILYLNSTFWMLYTARVLGVLKGFLRSLAFTSAFNIAEREATAKRHTSTTLSSPAIDQSDNKDGVEASSFESRRWLGIPIPCLLTASTPVRIQYSEAVATTSTAASEHILPTIASFVAAERLMHQTKPESGNWIEWGQMAQVAITVFGLLHLLYTILYQLMWKRPESFRRPRRFDEPLREYLRLLDSAYPSRRAQRSRASVSGTQSDIYELQDVVMSQPASALPASSVGPPS